MVDFGLGVGQADCIVGSDLVDFGVGSGRVGCYWQWQARFGVRDDLVDHVVDHS